MFFKKGGGVGAGVVTSSLRNLRFSFRVKNFVVQNETLNESDRITQSPRATPTHLGFFQDKNGVTPNRNVKCGQDRGVLQVVVVPATNGRTATWTARSTRAGTRHRVSEGQQVCWCGLRPCWLAPPPRWPQPLASRDSSVAPGPETLHL